MAISDILSDVGKGVSTVGRVAGAIAEPLGKSLVEEEAGYAPQIAAEKRQHQQSLEDAAINAKAQELQNQLAMGEKYGTLTPEDRQKYVDSITQLYSHPRHAATLMEKLRQAIHPQGAVYTPQTSLPSAVPTGGTLQADVRAATEKQHNRPVPGVKPFKGPDGRYYQPFYTPTGEVVNEPVEGYTPPVQKGAGKSPPLPGDKLPPDAAGPDGNPIPQEQRNAGQSFVEFQGSWWPVAKPKPVLKPIQGHLVLVDPSTGAKLRDLGPKDAAKVTTRQTLQPGDDGQMHLVSLTSVTTPEGATIDVQPESGETPSEGGGTTPPAPAQKGVAGILKPKTQARPVEKKPGGVEGRVVPGLSTLAKSKSPIFRADAESYKKANDDAISKSESLEKARGLLADNKRVTDLELVFSWVRSNVQGAGRMTNTEITQAANAGSYGTRIANAISQASTGRLAPQLEKQFFDDIQRSAEVAKKQADDLKKSLQAPSEGGGGIKIQRDASGRIVGIE